MQPYFFPYLGYFSLIDAVDRWIAYDTPQFPREGWVHRNRVLSKGASQWKYIHIPTIKEPLSTSIKDIRIDKRCRWRESLLRNLDYYYEHRAPYYQETIDFLSDVCFRSDESLSVTLIGMLREICHYVAMTPQIELFSESGCHVGPTNTPAERVLLIAHTLGATTYINLPGGRALYDPVPFRACGIDLRFIAPKQLPYFQGRETFVPDLSIIDALMWNSRSEVLSMIRAYELLP